MDDYNILKYLGIELKDDSIIFYDDEPNEHLLKYNEIKEISIDKAYTTIANKLRFWIGKQVVISHKFGFPDSKNNTEDYRDNYELEIELNDHRVLSRKVSGIQLYEVEAFLNELNSKIKAL